VGFIAGHPGFSFTMCLRRFAYMWTAFWNLDPSNLDVEFHYPGNVFLTVVATVLMLAGPAASVPEVSRNGDSVSVRAGSLSADLLFHASGDSLPAPDRSGDSSSWRRWAQGSFCWGRKPSAPPTSEDLSARTA